MTLLYCDEVSCKSQVLNHKYPARMIRCSEALDASDCFDCSLASVCSHQLSYYSVLVACANVVGPCFRLSEIEGGELRLAFRQSSTNGGIVTVFDKSFGCSSSTMHSNGSDRLKNK